MKIKLIREVDTEEMYGSMMRDIFKIQGKELPFWRISDETILGKFEKAWENETHTKVCETLTLEENIVILHEFKDYVKNNIFKNNY